MPAMRPAFVHTGLPAGRIVMIFASLYPYAATAAEITAITALLSTAGAAGAAAGAAAGVGAAADFSAAFFVGSMT